MASYSCPFDFSSRSVCSEGITTPNSCLFWNEGWRHLQTLITQVHLLLVHTMDGRKVTKGDSSVPSYTERGSLQTLMKKAFLYMEVPTIRLLTYLPVASFCLQASLHLCSEQPPKRWPLLKGILCQLLKCTGLLAQCSSTAGEGPELQPRDKPFSLGFLSTPMTATTVSLWL